MFHSTHITAGEREAPSKERSRKHKMRRILRNHKIALKSRAENDQKKPFAQDMRGKEYLK
jgi:hypothetical protein